MRLLFIYDTTDLKTVTETVGRLIEAIPAINHKHVLTIDEQGKRKLYDVAVDIKKEIPVNEDCIIFIDQYLACADEGFEWLQRNSGIALIKFLRMLEVRTHIVLITPFADEVGQNDAIPIIKKYKKVKIELIRQNPGNLIITSKGISFIKNLHEFSKNSTSELEELARDVFDDKQDLKPYILAEFRLPEDEKHNWANWWGIVQLTDVHRSLFPNELIDLNKQYFSDIDEKLKSLRNVLALYLFNHKVDFNKAIDEAVLNGYQKQKNNLSAETERLKKQVNGTGKKSPKPDDWTDYIRDRQNIIEENKYNYRFDSKVLENQITKAKTDLEQGKIELGIKKEKLKETDKKIYDLKHRTVEVALEFRSEIAAYRYTANNKPKIIYIDDNAGKGWSEILQTLLYGRKQPDNIFKPIQDTSKEIDCLYSDIKEQIGKIEPNLILLDLRLKNESGTHLNVEALSGAQILERIREDFPGLPVMMTTASNKIWSYQTLLNLGADAYWMKEGIEISTSLTKDEKANFTVKNYKKFLFLIDKLAGEEYQFMRKISIGIEKLKEKYDPRKASSPTDAWWKNTASIPEWSRITQSPQLLTYDEYNNVFDLLNLGLKMYKNNFLKQYRLNSESTLDNLTEDEKTLLANIINTLHQVIELIHRNNKGEALKQQNVGCTFTKSGKDVTQAREDYISFYLNLFRGASSHGNGISFIKYKYFKSYFAGLLAHLSLDSYIKIDQDAIGLGNEADHKKCKNWGTEGMDINSNFINMVNSANAYKIIFGELV